jgi:hypothetical protein
MQRHGAHYKGGRDVSIGGRITYYKLAASLRQAERVLSAPEVLTRPVGAVGAPASCYCANAGLLCAGIETMRRRTRYTTRDAPGPGRLITAGDCAVLPRAASVCVELP